MNKPSKLSTIPWMDLLGQMLYNVLLDSPRQTSCFSTLVKPICHRSGRSGSLTLFNHFDCSLLRYPNTTWGPKCINCERVLVCSPISLSLAQSRAAFAMLLFSSFRSYLLQCSEKVTHDDSLLNIHGTFLNRLQNGQKRPHIPYLSSPSVSSSRICALFTKKIMVIRVLNHIW